MRPLRSVLLFTTPRSGSTLLCTLLRDADVAGRPESWFRTQNRAEFAAGWGLPPEPAFADYLQAAIRAGQSPNGTFGLRMMANNLSELVGDLAGIYGSAPDPALLGLAFGDIFYVRLKRRDTVAQAVSRYRAEASGLWHRNNDGSPRELFGDAPKSVTYDASTIAAHLAEIEALDAQWDRWFITHKITPLFVTYETLSADPAATARKLLEDLGQTATSPVRPGTAKLADAESANWIARFRHETGRF